MLRRRWRRRAMMRSVAWPTHRRCRGGDRCGRMRWLLRHHPFGRRRRRGGHCSRFGRPQRPRRCALRRRGGDITNFTQPPRPAITALTLPLSLHGAGVRRPALVARGAAVPGHKLASAVPRAQLPARVVGLAAIPHPVHLLAVHGSTFCRRDCRKVLRKRPDGRRERAQRDEAEQNKVEEKSTKPMHDTRHPSPHTARSTTMIQCPITTSLRRFGVLIASTFHPRCFFAAQTHQPTRRSRAKRAIGGPNLRCKCRGFCVKLSKLGRSGENGPGEVAVKPPLEHLTRRNRTGNCPGEAVP